ncbi:MAG: hypothetical protein JO061_06825, partial [Acidobacteriaceae bacterium]|nr:hypothetical protein [Acidobacteriaceae bacterium]
CVRFFGDAGFVVADMLVVVLFSFALRWLLVASGSELAVAECLTVIVASMTGAFFMMLPAGALLWDPRFPRPFVTELFVVIFLGCAAGVLSNPGSLRWYVAAAAALSCVLQADIYQGQTVAILCVWIAWKARPTFRAAATFVITAILLSAPFLYQQIHASPDALCRFGVFPTGHRLLPVISLTQCVMSVIVAALLWRVARRDRPVAQLLVAAVICSLVAPHVSSIVLGKSLQPYHFAQDAEHITGYALLLIFALFLKKIPAAVASALACVSLFIGAGLVYASVLPSAPVSVPMSMAADAGTFDLSHYRDDYVQLHPHLPWHGILATTDIALANEWQFRGGHLFTPDTFSSTVQNSELDSRVLAFAHLMRCDEDDFQNLLKLQYFRLRFLGGARYQANTFFTPFAVESYSPVSQRHIRQMDVTQCWQLEMPESEQRRLVEAYRATCDIKARWRRPEVIVLNRGYMRQLLHPERNPKLHRVWNNYTFDVWK